MVRVIAGMMLGCFLAGVLPAGQDTLGEADREILLHAPAAEARKRWRRAYVIYMEGPRTNVPKGVQRPELYREATHCYARNPRVREYYETFFKETPHTISTASRRARVFRDLNDLKAEWAVRLLASEMMTDRQWQEYNNAPYPRLTEDELISRVQNGRASDFLRNDKAAVYTLHRKKLRGMPNPSYFGGEGSNFLEAMRQWYRENEHRIGELVYEKWGDWAVMDRDMPGYRGKSAGSAGKRLPARRAGNGQKKNPGKAPARKQRVKWWIAAACLLAMACCYLWLERRKAGRRLLDSRK